MPGFAKEGPTPRCPMYGAALALLGIRMIPILLVLLKYDRRHLDQVPANDDSGSTWACTGITNFMTLEAYGIYSCLVPIRVKPFAVSTLLQEYLARDTARG